MTDQAHQLDDDKREDGTPQATGGSPASDNDMPDTSSEVPGAPETAAQEDLEGHSDGEALGPVVAESSEGLASIEAGDGTNTAVARDSVDADSGNEAAEDDGGGDHEAGNKEEENEEEVGEDEEDDDDEEEEEEEEEEDDEDDDDEPRLKYARLTPQLTSIYRNGDATSTFLVAGDKMVWTKTGMDMLHWLILR